MTRFAKAWLAAGMGLCTALAPEPTTTLSAEKVLLPDAMRN